MRRATPRRPCAKSTAADQASSPRPFSIAKNGEKRRLMLQVRIPVASRLPHRRTLLRLCRCCCSSFFIGNNDDNLLWPGQLIRFRDFLRCGKLHSCRSVGWSKIETLPPRRIPMDGSLWTRPRGPGSGTRPDEQQWI